MIPALVCYVSVSAAMLVLGTLWGVPWRRTVFVALLWPVLIVFVVSAALYYFWMKPNDDV